MLQEWRLSMGINRWSESTGYCQVEISEEAMAKIVAIADRAHPNEGGAALYGRYTEDGKTAVIEGVAPESKNSGGGRFDFKRGALGLAGFFRRLFERSGGEKYYVGDFHSHPGGSPVPSRTDEETQFSIARDGNSRCESPIMVIVGGTPKSRDIAVFVHTRAGNRYALHRVT